MLKRLVLSVCSSLLVVSGVSLASGTEAPLSAAESKVLIEGTVVETMNVSGYTYVCIANEGHLEWAATRGTTVAVGEEVEIISGAVMNNFTSESLGRTFETVIFTNRIIKR